MKVKFGKFPISDEPIFCGVANISLESFYEGSRISSSSELENKIRVMVEGGAQIIDIGAISTRPVEIYGGDIKTTYETEKERYMNYLPLIMELKESYNFSISIDTQNSKIAEYSIGLGAEIINDVSGLNYDPSLAKTVAEANVNLVIMAANKHPGDVIGIDQTINALIKSVEMAEYAGIKREKLAIDPGFGGWQNRDEKTDFEMIKNFERFKQFDLPIFIGISRKSTIKALNGGNTPNERLVGSIILTNLLIDKGANIIRTHDIKDTIQGYKVHRNLKML
jgi:dihydropteroate synthase